MTHYLVVSVHDLRQANMAHGVDQMTVRVGFDSATPTAVTALSDKQTFTRQIECPPSATSVRVQVASIDGSFWDADMTLTIVRDKLGRPHLDPKTGFTQFNVTDLLGNVANNGKDWIARLEVTVSQLRDYESTVRGGTAISGRDPFTPLSTADAGANATNFTYSGLWNSAVDKKWRRPDSTAPLLVKGPVAASSPGDAVSEASWDRIAHVQADPTGPVGRMYFAQFAHPGDPDHKHGPRYVAIWRPKFIEFPNDPVMHRHGFHVFFHPAIQAKWKWKDVNYFDLPRRYLFTEKGMLQQHYWTQRKVFLVMPVGSDVDQQGSLSSWSAVERLLREVLFFVLRIEKAGPLRPRFQDIGRVALSAFSWGINIVTPLLSGAGKSALREVYSFDGVDASHGAFNQALLAWANGGSSADPRSFRIYTTGAPDPNVAKAVGGAPSTFTSSVTVVGWDKHSRGPDKQPLTKPATYSVTTQEWEGNGRTLVSIPDVAWQGLIVPQEPGVLDPDTKQPKGDRERFFGSAHQTVPGLFPFHAIDTSGFKK